MKTEDQDFVDNLLIRQAMSGDANLIINSWLASFRDGDMVQGVPNQIYYNRHHKVVESILSRATVTVLCDQSAPEVIFAWICWENFENGIVIHYAYVKQEFRNARLMSRLIEAIFDSEEPSVVFCTHRVKPMGFEFRKRGWIYNPYLLAKDFPQ